MNKNMIFETLKELAEEQSKKESEIKTNQNQNKSKKGSDSAAASYINTVMKQTKLRNPAKLIHNSIFRY